MSKLTKTTAKTQSAAPARIGFRRLERMETTNSPCTDVS